MKKIFLLCIFVLLLTGCNTENELIKKYPGAHVISLNESSATIDGQPIKEYDYTWHIDNTKVHDEVENSPAEYHTGTKPEDTIYLDHDLVYFPKQDESEFKIVDYDGEKEYASYYKDGQNDEYIFSTLPSFRNFPSNMMHTEEEASQNVVLHIKEAGTYILSGSFNGQINISLDDEDAFTNPEDKVTIVLNGVDIKCTVAPAIIFDNLYECDNTWEEHESSNIIDTNDAGANVIIVDGSSNTVKGANIYRILKTKYKDEESKEIIKVQKKAYKIDAAFYSYVSINVDGEEKDDGELLIESTFEGFDSELHFTINGGNVVINSQDDGINVNEDDVSVLTINGGTIKIYAGLGQEGDGIDSNGFITLNGGKLCVYSIEPPDNYVDSELGILCNGGEVYLDDKLYDMQLGQTVWEIGNERGRDRQKFGINPEDPGINNEFDIKEFKKKVAELDDTATIQDVYELLGSNMMIPKDNFRFEGDDNFDPSQMGEPPMDEMPRGQEPLEKK